MLAALPAEPPVQVAPARFVRIALAAKITGLSVRAIELKIAKGQWREGKEFRRAPDTNIYIDMQGYEKWVARERVSNYAKSPSASGSNSRASGAEKP